MMRRYRAKTSLHALAPHHGGTLLFTAAIVANGLMFEVATSDCGLRLPLYACAAASMPNVIKAVSSLYQSLHVLSTAPPLTLQSFLLQA